MKTGVSRPLLYEEVVEELYSLIDQNKIKPGEQFPSERELVRQFDISRNVLREAFHMLEDRGVIYSKQGKGRYLRELPESEHVREYESASKNIERYSLLEIYETRQVLEVKVMQQLVKYAGEEDLREIQGCFAEIDTQFHSSGTTNGEFRLHRLYAVKCGNNFLAHLVGLALKTTLDMMKTSFRDVLLNHTTEDSLNAHRAIIEAVARRDADAAARTMADHIQRSIDLLR